MNLFPPLTNLFIAQDTLGSGAPLRVKGTVCNEVVFSVPSPRTLELNRLLLAGVNILTLGPARGGSATLRGSGCNAHLLDEGSGAWETLFCSMPALETLVLCKTALHPPLDAICQLGRLVPSTPDRLPHLRHLYLDRCELEHSSGGGSERPDAASCLKRLLLHRARIDNPIRSVKCYYCGPMTLCEERETELRALVGRFEYATAPLIPQVVVPRRVRETMGAVRYRSFGKLCPREVLTSLIISVLPFRQNDTPRCQPLQMQVLMLLTREPVSVSMTSCMRHFATRGRHLLIRKLRSSRSCSVVFVTSDLK
jgi:hypothetical protein